MFTVRNARFWKTPHLVDLTEANDPKDVRRKIPFTKGLPYDPEDSPYTKKISESELADPKNKITIMFVAGSGFKVLNINSGCELFLIDNQIWRRISARDIGMDRQSGLKYQRDGMTIYYVQLVMFKDPNHKDEIIKVVCHEVFNAQ